MGSFLSALLLNRCKYLFKNKTSGSCLAGLVAEPGMIRHSSMANAGNQDGWKELKSVMLQGLLVSEKWRTDMEQKYQD